MLPLLSFPDFRSALVGWNQALNSREVAALSSTPPDRRIEIIKDLGRAFAAVMAAAAKWETEAAARNVRFGIEEEPDALRSAGPVIARMTADLARVLGIRQDFSGDEPPCWSPRYESYIHSAMPMYKITEVIQFKGQSVTLPEELNDETEIVAKLSGRPTIGYTMNMDEIDDVLHRVKTRGRTQVLNKDNTAIMALVRSTPRAATDIELFSGMVYLTAREHIDAKPGQQVTTLTTRIWPLLHGDPALSEEIAEEQRVQEFEREQEYRAIAMAKDATFARRSAVAEERGLGQRERRPSAAERRRMATTRTK